MKHSVIPRIFVSLFGAALIVWGIGLLGLGIVGEQGTATITNIRRQGGEIEAGVPGRYIYHIGYLFYVPDGRSFDGWTTRVGDAGYVKADGKSTIAIRYLKSLPIVNAPVSSTDLSLGQPALVFFGLILIIAMNNKRTRKYRNARTPSKY